jgi:outer membrane protein
MTRFRAALLLVPFIAASASSAHALTLKEALATAYMTNPQLETARANLRATDEDVAKANAGWRPTISVTGTEGYQNLITDKPTHSEDNRNQLSGTATVSEPLFTGGRTVAEIRRAKALVRAGRAVLLGTEETVLLDAATAYLDVWRDLRVVNYRREQVGVLQDQLQATNSQLNLGAITQTDAAQTQARLAAAMSGLSLAEGQLGSSRARFERAVGRPAESLEDTPPVPEFPSLLEVVDHAEQNTPTLVAAKENATAADYAIDDAIGALLPQLSLALEYQYSKNATVLGVISPNVTQRGATAYVQLTVPLYQGGQAQALVRQARQQHNQALYNVADVERQVRQAAASGWQLLQAAKAAIVTDQTQVAADTIAVNGVIQEQRAGERSVLEVLNAQQELLNSEIDLTNARHDSTVIAYQLLAAAGELTAMSLALDVKLYDPAEHYNRAATAWFRLSD